MSNKLDQPAHPVTSCQDHEFVGLTIRDHFAAKAMQAIISGCLSDGLDYPHRNNTAERAYAYADAMLEARIK